MVHARQRLVGILREAIALLSLPGNDFLWSSWKDAEQAVAELSKHIATLEAGRLPAELDLTVIFAPTGPMQEVSLSSGWGDEFQQLASRFDSALDAVYHPNFLQRVLAGLSAVCAHRKPK